MHVFISDPTVLQDRNWCAKANSEKDGIIPVNSSKFSTEPCGHQGTLHDIQKRL